MAIEFEYSAKSQRYRWKDSKKFVSNKLVERLKEAHVAGAKKRVQVLTQSMLDGNLTVDEWERAMSKELKSAYIQSYSLGKPGAMELTDRGALGNKLRFVYAKLYKFRNDVIEGKLSDAQIKHRAGLYTNNINWGYEKARNKSHIDAGFLWERRVKPATESCTECIAYNVMGWQPIGFLPEATEQCACRANCKCYKAYSSDALRPVSNSYNPLQPLSLEETISLENSEMKVSFDIPNLDNPDVAQVKLAIQDAENAFRASLKQTVNRDPIENAIAKFGRETVEVALKEIVANPNKKVPCQHNHLINKVDDPMGTPNPKDNDELPYVTNKYDMGIPSEEQYEKMKRFLPNNGALAKREDYVVAAFVASNNLLWRSGAVWSSNALKTMTMQYPGLPHIVDHDSYSVSSIRGLIYDAEFVRSATAPERLMEKVNYDLNLEIVKREGLAEMIVFSAFDRNCQFLKEMSMGMYNDVSTGCMVDANKFMCPHDGSYFGEGKKWYQCAHGHFLPSPYLAQYYYDEDELEMMAPYYIVDVVNDTMELSMVVRGNLPGARLIKDGYEKY